MKTFVVEPNDRWNQELVAQVHPPQWKNPKPQPRYNLVVIGAGTAGLVTAAGAAGLGAKVALIERHLMGGDCLNVGCVPSKAVIRAGKAAFDAREAKEFGVSVGEVRPDFGFAMERMRRLRSEISHHDSAARFTELGVDVFIGEACFSSPTTIQVGDATLPFSKAVIASGARATIPAIPGIAEAGVLTNESVFSLTKLPRRFVVIGGRPIGCELAQAFRRLGSEVTVVTQEKRIFPRDHGEASRIVGEVFIREGIKLVTEATIERIDRSGDERKISLTVGGAPLVLVGDEVLIATGRTPNVEGLNLEVAGVTYDRSGVKVDATLRTSNPRIFSCGDVCMEHKFTHAADAAARIVIQNALFFGKKRLDSLVMSWATFTDPEVASVGKSAEQLQRDGVAFIPLQKPLSGNDRAITDGETEGFVELLVSPKGKILGATVVARAAGDIVSEIAVAMSAGVSVSSLATIIHPYQNQGRAVKQAADLFGKQRLTPFIKRVFSSLCALQR